jgi:hypothetical protein
VEAPLMPLWQRSNRRNGTVFVAPLAAGVLIVLLAFLVISGHRPEFRGLVHPSAEGLIAIAPS